MIDAQAATLRAVAELETARAEIREMGETLATLSTWRPAAGLRKSGVAALEMLDRMAERFDRKLVVTLVGPCGSGKSTLLNALAGQDGLSAAGRQRPTTRQVVAFCRRRADADQLTDRLGAENIRIHASEAADRLENVILIDTPDTDSTHQDRHLPIIHKAITLSDVLICVFDAENPKRRDHTDFLAPYVNLFAGGSLVVAVNKCDRLDETELTETIMPEFNRYIRDAWSVSPAAVLCISARSRLTDPGWSDQVRPRHGRNQFDDLQRLIVETFNRAGYSVDRRLENAYQLRDTIIQAVRDEARRDRDRIAAAMDRMTAAETEAMQAAVADFRGAGNGLVSGLNMRLYQQLAQRWLGPVGWLVAFWARLLVFGAGIAGLLRFGSPLRQITGAVSAVRRYGTSKKALDDAERGTGTGAALYRYDSAITRVWPDIAEMLVAARFSPTVRDDRQATGGREAMGRRLSELWSAALERELALTGRRLSGGMLQLVFNLPTLGVLGYAGWLTATTFFAGKILTGDFFLHAFWTIVLVLLLSFFLLQGVIRLAAGKDRLAERIFAGVRDAVDRQSSLAENDVWRQARMILGLAS